MTAAFAHAGSVSTTQCYDTFINSLFSSNNNGGSTTFFTGRGGDDAGMRALIRCDLPAAINVRTTVTQATLTVKTAGLGPTGTANPTAATETLQVLTQPWGEGNKAGTTSTTYTVGQACTTGEATWNQNQCSITNWTTAGGSVGTTSASAASPSSIGTNVAFTSANMASDVQNWIAGSNYGWRMSSSTEGTAGQAQRFSSKESGAGPSLAITFACNPGFLDTGTSCSACTSAAQAACVTSQSGNTCIDPGPPSGYHCACSNPSYTGTGTGSCTYLTTTNVTASPSTSTVFGQTVTFTAGVTGNSPTGTVDFLDGATTLCSGVTLASNQATCAPPSVLSVGSHSIQANYSGDTANGPSTGSLTQTVDQATSTTAIGSTTLVNFGDGETISVTVAAQSPGAGTPTGTVTIDDGTGDQCIAPLSSGAGSCMLTPTSAGSKTLTATYSGDANFTGGTGSGSLTVNPASSTTALTTQCMLRFVQGQPFTMTASVTGANPTGNVDFSDGSNAICSSVILSSGAADCTTNALTVPSGTQYVYELTANYDGDGNNTTSGSSPLTVTVLSAADVLFRNGFEVESPSCPIE